MVLYSFTKKFFASNDGNKTENGSDTTMEKLGNESDKSKRNVNKFGDRISWGNHIYEIIDSDQNIFYRPYNHEKIDKLKKYKSNGKVLDCGCHIGRWIEVFRENGYDYTGIDQSYEALETVKKYKPNGKFVHSLLWNMSFNEEFDIAHFNAVLQHNKLKEQEKIIPKIYQALKTNGILIIAESTVNKETQTQRTYQGWIKFIEKHGFKFMESWHKNELGLEDNYLFIKTEKSIQILGDKNITKEISQKPLNKEIKKYEYLYNTEIMNNIENCKGNNLQQQNAANLMPSNGAIPRYSIILPTYNNPKYLKLCVLSIIENSYYKTHQLCVHVNGYDKETIDFLDDLKISYTLSQENIGIPDAVNMCVDRAIYDKVLGANDDCYFSKNWDYYLHQWEQELDNKFPYHIKIIGYRFCEPNHPTSFQPICEAGHSIDSFDINKFYDYIKIHSKHDIGNWMSNSLYPTKLLKMFRLSSEFNPKSYCDTDFIMSFIRYFNENKIPFLIFSVKDCCVYHFQGIATKKHQDIDNTAKFKKKWNMSYQDACNILHKEEKRSIELIKNLKDI
jgi:2-polyprenyl-3-methyl-5-hydroxy-6-metoxy-1,4-benzoquinol methylase/glycosyltransferase involved in cell wall biosynthesis